MKSLISLHFAFLFFLSAAAQSGGGDEFETMKKLARENEAAAKKAEQEVKRMRYNAVAAELADRSIENTGC